MSLNSICRGGTRPPSNPMQPFANEAKTPEPELAKSAGSSAPAGESTFEPAAKPLVMDLTGQSKSKPDSLKQDLNGATEALSAATDIKADAWKLPSAGEWTLDAHGVRSDPVNLYVHGSLDELKASFEKAGWTQAKEYNKSNNLNYLEDIPVELGFRAVDSVIDAADKVWDWLKGKRDIETLRSPVEDVIQSMPVSSQTMNGKKQVMAFEKSNDPLRGRHHFRVFDTGTKDEQGKPVWAVAACRDTRIKFDKNRPEQAFLTHAVEANTDWERDALLNDMKNAQQVASCETHQLDYGKDPSPATGARPVDGNVYELRL